MTSVNALKGATFISTKKNAENFMQIKKVSMP